MFCYGPLTFESTAVKRARDIALGWDRKKCIFSIITN